jgi:hypothetical protein
MRIVLRSLLFWFVVIPCDPAIAADEENVFGLPDAQWIARLPLFTTPKAEWEMNSDDFRAAGFVEAGRVPIEVLRFLSIHREFTNDLFSFDNVESNSLFPDRNGILFPLPYGTNNVGVPDAYGVIHIQAWSQDAKREPIILSNTTCNREHSAAWFDIAKARAFDHVQGYGEAAHITVGYVGPETGAAIHVTNSVIPFKKRPEQPYAGFRRVSANNPKGTLIRLKLEGNVIDVSPQHFNPQLMGRALLSNHHVTQMAHPTSSRPAVAVTIHKRIAIESITQRVIGP